MEGVDMTPDPVEVTDDLRIDDAELFADEREWLDEMRACEQDREAEIHFARYGW
jgi:hypothetical protein